MRERHERNIEETREGNGRGSGETKKRYIRAIEETSKEEISEGHGRNTGETQKRYQRDTREI